MIVYIEDQGDEYCVYIRSTFIDARYENYFLIRLTKQLEQIKRQLAIIDCDYIYIDKERLKNYL